MNNKKIIKMHVRIEVLQSMISWNLNFTEFFFIVYTVDMVSVESRSDFTLFILSSHTLSKRSKWNFHKCFALKTSPINCVLCITVCRLNRSIVTMYRHLLMIGGRNALNRRTSVQSFKQPENKKSEMNHKPIGDYVIIVIEHYRPYQSIAGYLRGMSKDAR